MVQARSASSPLPDQSPRVYAVPEQRQLAQLDHIRVHDLALALEEQTPVPTDQLPLASVDWACASPTSSIARPSTRRGRFDLDRDHIRPLAGPLTTQTRRRRAASTATVAGEWAGAPAPSRDRILAASSSSSSSTATSAARPPTFRRSASAGTLLGTSRTGRSSTLLAGPVPASSPSTTTTIDEEVVNSATDPAAAGAPSGPTATATRTRSASHASVASSVGSTSTIREAPRIPRPPRAPAPTNIPTGDGASHIYPYTSFPSSGREKQKRRRPGASATSSRLVESFVSLELLPPASGLDRNNPDATGSTGDDSSTVPNAGCSGRTRSGSVQSSHGGGGDKSGGRGAQRASSTSRSGSTGAVHHHDPSSNGGGPGPGPATTAPFPTSAPSPRKRMRRRTISSALFAPLPTLSSLAAAAAAVVDDKATRKSSAPPPPPDPFYVSDVAPPATHASFFLDPDNCILPDRTSTPTPTSTLNGLTVSGRHRVAAFPEEVQDWPGWRQSRFKVTLWGRADPDYSGGAAEQGRQRAPSESLAAAPEAEAPALEDDGWRVLVEWEVDLAGLTSLGRDPAAFPKLPPNTLIFALSTTGGAVSCFPDVVNASGSSRSADSATNLLLPAAADQVEYFTAPMPLLEKAYRRRLRTARRARLAAAAAAAEVEVPQVPQRSWSEDELSDYLFECCCDDSDCSSCFGGASDDSDRDHGRQEDSDDDGVTGGHASDPGVSQAAASRAMIGRGGGGSGGGGGGGRMRSDTLRSRRAAAAAGRRGTVVSLRRGDPSRPRIAPAPPSRPLGRSSNAKEEDVRYRAQTAAAAVAVVVEEDVLEKSRRETRMVRAAGWDEIRHLCEARWELECGASEVDLAKRAVEAALGADESGWAAQERFRAELRDRLDDLEGVQEAVEAELSEEQHELDIRAALLRQRRRRLEEAKRLESAQLTQLDGNATLLDAMDQEVADLAQSIQTRQTQLITLLSHIFPIEPVPTAPRGVSPDLLFSILRIALPNSTFPSAYSDDLASSALGYAAQVTQLLAAYLAVPVAYPITCRGSRSYLRDEISVMNGSRAFPLFAKGVDRYRFDYAVFLLNKDIEQLMFSQGLTVLDLRNTLPNLMTLILSLSYDPSHDDYLASTLSPTGPFASPSRSSFAADDGAEQDEPSAQGDQRSSSLASTDGPQEGTASARTRSSRSGSNASTIRPSRPPRVENAEADDSGGAGDARSVMMYSEEVDSLAATCTTPDAAAAAPLPAPPPPPPLHGRKTRRSRRRSSSSASEKVTLVTTVQKAAVASDRSSSSGSATGGSGDGGGGGDRAGSGYGAKLREGLWTVVAGSAGRRDSSGPRDAVLAVAEDRLHSSTA
ncbi:hypothetical protein JCM3774_005341 [Rhodotorula dairenensis]